MNYSEKISSELTTIFNDFKESFNGKELNAIVSRHFKYAIPEKNDILVTGLNPSFSNREKNKGTLCDYVYSTQKSAFFKSIRSNIGSENVSYMDLLYYRNTKADVINDFLYEKAEFIVRQLTLSQQIIEDAIEPKIILVQSEPSYKFWGILDDIWMGYEFKKVMNLKEGVLYEITGFKEKDNCLRLNFDRKQTNLVGTAVYFSKTLDKASSKTKTNIKEDFKIIKELYIK